MGYDVYYTYNFIGENKICCSTSLKEIYKHFKRKERRKKLDTIKNKNHVS